MQANQCRIKIIRNANPRALEVEFGEWASVLPDECTIEGQPVLDFSASQAQFIVACTYTTPFSPTPELAMKSNKK